MRNWQHKTKQDYTLQSLSGCPKDGVHFSSCPGHNPIGAGGVIASLLYLTNQLRQNTRQIEYDVKTSEVAAYQEMTRRIVDNRHVLMSAQTLSTLLDKVGDNEELTSEEKRRYSVYVLSMLSNADAAYFQYEKGLLSEERLYALFQPLLRHFRSYRFSNIVWRDLKHEFVQSFCDYLEKKLDRG